MPSLNAVIASGAKQSIARQKSENGLLRSARNDGEHAFAISPLVSREFCQQISALFEKRARGMPDARCVRSRACSVVSTRVSHHGHTGITRHPRAMVYGLFRALPGDRACLSPSPRGVSSTKLDASVGASGPHGFAVRLKRIRQSAIRVHRIPPHVRDDRETPLEKRQDGKGCKVIWVGREREYFCRRGWTRNR
jgi:hypothetical protein